MTHQHFFRSYTFNVFSLIFLIFSVSCFAIFAVSTMFTAYKGHKPSYYFTQTTLVSEFSLTANVLTFKSESSHSEYSLVFKEIPVIQKTDKIKVESNSSKGYVQVYINKKLAYDKYSDITFIEKFNDKKTGQEVISVIKNIK